MNMRRFVLNKLVRSHVVELFKKDGVVANAEILKDNEQYLEALSNKLIEELEETFAAQDRNELVKEIADLEDALAAFKELVGISNQEVKKAQEEKHKEKGDFSKRLFIHYIDVPKSAKKVIEYCESQPDKYPEVEIED